MTFLIRARYVHMMMTHACQRLRYAREMAGYETAKAAADALGIRANTYRHYETGRSQLPMKDALRYAALFRVEVGWLLYGEGPMKSDDVGRRAAQIAQEMTPEDRAAWFQIGEATLRRSQPGGGEESRADRTAQSVSDPEK